MRLEPVNNWIIGRSIVPKVEDRIIVPDAAKGITRSYLIEAVSPGAAKEGYKPGDIVVAKSVYDMIFPRTNRITFLASEVICFVRDAAISEFVDLKGNEVQPIEVAA